MKISELPNEVRLKALEYQKNDPNNDKSTDDLDSAFTFADTIECPYYWFYWHKKQSKEQTESLMYTFQNETAEDLPAEDLTNIKQYYDNSKGSIYKFCNDQSLNAWEFDLIKRIVRCRKKGQFKEDLEKTKILIDLYLNEYEK